MHKSSNSVDLPFLREVPRRGEGFLLIIHEPLRYVRPLKTGTSEQSEAILPLIKLGIYPNQAFFYKPEITKRLIQYINSRIPMIFPF
jgi:hypothetical protein